MMAWRKLEDTFHSDRKIRKLANGLGIIEPYAAGHIATLWSWALLHAKDGDLSKFDVEDIEHGAKWAGPHGAFFDECVAARLIDVNDDGSIELHNWLERGGSFAEAQRKRTKRLKAQKDSSRLSETVRENPGQSGTILDCPGKSALEENRVEENRLDHKEQGHVSEIPKPKTSTSQTLPVSTGAKAPALFAGGNGQGKLIDDSKVEHDDIQEIWLHYRTHHPRTAKQLRSNRKEYTLVRDRLVDFDVDSLKEAIDGYHANPFYCGKNDRKRAYLGLTLIMRDVTHVQEGIEMLADAENSKRSGPRVLDPKEIFGDTAASERAGNDERDK